MDLAKIHLAADLAKLYGDQAQSDLLAALARIEKLLTQQDSTANVIRKFLDAPLPTGIKVVSDSEDKPDKRCNMCGDWATWETALDTKYKGCNIHGPDMLIHDGTSYAIIPVIQPSDDHPCKEEANGENKT